MRERLLGRAASPFFLSKKKKFYKKRGKREKITYTNNNDILTFRERGRFFADRD